jgi:hypothetical protein
VLHRLAILRLLCINVNHAGEYNTRISLRCGREDEPIGILIRKLEFTQLIEGI